MELRVVEKSDGKHFVWPGKGSERSETLLRVYDFETFSNYRVLREGKELDTGWISEPRGDRFYFFGLRTVYPSGGAYFLDISVDLFKAGDVIEFFNRT